MKLALVSSALTRVVSLVRWVWKHVRTNLRIGREVWRTKYYRNNFWNFAVKGSEKRVGGVITGTDVESTGHFYSFLF